MLSAVVSHLDTPSGLQSSYVNQLYATSSAYMEEGEQQQLDEKRRARVRGILASIPVQNYAAGQAINDE